MAANYIPNGMILQACILAFFFRYHSASTPSAHPESRNVPASNAWQEWKIHRLCRGIEDRLVFISHFGLMCGQLTFSELFGLVFHELSPDLG